MKIALIISLIFHMITLPVKITEKKKPKKPKPKIKLKHRGSNKKRELYAEQPEDKKAKNLEKKKKSIVIKHAKKKCKNGNSYIGIGVNIDFLSGSISRIGKGTPASKSGFKVGDTFVNPEVRIKDKYPKGTTIKVPVYRKGIIINIAVTVDKICYN